MWNLSCVVVVVLLSLVLPSRGTALASAASPSVKEEAYSASDHTFQATLVTLPILPSVSSSASHPLTDKGASNSALSAKPQNAPSQLTLPKVGVPPPTSKAPRLLAARHVVVPIPALVPSGTPSVQAHAPAVGLKPNQPGNTVPPANASSHANDKNNNMQHAAPPKETSIQRTPVHKSPTRGPAAAVSPVPHNTRSPSVRKNAPSGLHAQPPSPGTAPRSAPSSTSSGRLIPKKRAPNPSFAPSYQPPHVQGPAVSGGAKQIGTKIRKHHAPPPMFEGPSTSAFPPVALPTEPKTSQSHPIWALPPPPPNLDCNSLACPEPLTGPPSGASCVCVLPIKVGVRLSVELYSFFPLVGDFAEEVASGLNMVHRQVRVMGANVASEQPGKTVVLVDLVPLKVKFDNATAFTTFERLWGKKVSLEPSLFGDYEILYIVYPGLPPSPPSAPANVAVDDAAFDDRNARALKPLAFDVISPKRKVNGGLITIVILSTIVALVVCTLAAWLLKRRFRDSDDMAERFPHRVLPKLSRSSAHTPLGGRRSSQSVPSGSLCLSIVTYTGQAKTFKFAEIENATNGFDDLKVIGEGGFGCVYQGTLEDGTRVAVKVLKRYDNQGEREFLAEVEMLGRLHHRNLVKLLGICIEENTRCLIYELIPNGSVESHLHGVDSETQPLDWNTRMKIALGAARALAYLHEDSSPCVIHRDFKSSNILLEYDFTPKVSDFGLARTAMVEGSQHVSTHVMGTFGYVAPEYAMTGHLIVKSDVYSYGVVLLELLTGMKPVDMSRLPGQESLVSWARPLLANMVSLREAVDRRLGNNAPLDSVAKVAAIASMCVQPEVAHRPSMGEVVQALTLVCIEGDEGNGPGSVSQELSARTMTVRDVTGHEAEMVLLADMFGSSPVFTPAVDSDSFHKQCSSGPLMTGKNRKFWQRMRNLSRGSMSDHGGSLDYETRSWCSDR